MNNFDDDKGKRDNVTKINEMKYLQGRIIYDDS